MIALFQSRLPKELSDPVKEECSSKEIIGSTINLNKQLLQAVLSEDPIIPRFHIPDVYTHFFDVQPCACVDVLSSD